MHTSSLDIHYYCHCSSDIYATIVTCFASSNNDDESTSAYNQIQSHILLTQTLFGVILICMCTTHVCERFARSFNTHLHILSTHSPQQREMINFGFFLLIFYVRSVLVCSNEAQTVAFGSCMSISIDTDSNTEMAKMAFHFQLKSFASK